MRVALTDHAKLQMRRRGIGVEDIRTALTNTHTSYPGTNSKGDTVVKVGTTGDGRDLAVVVAKDDERLIVTTYWKHEDE